MNQSKEILILANSIKKGGRCIAGKELVTTEDGQKVVGDWIRPIDATGAEGTISLMKAKLRGRFIRPLDSIKIPFTGYANDPLHPEDWHIDLSVEWEKTNSYRPSVFSYLPDDSGDLWGGISANSRKVKPTGNMPTLRLIKPVRSVTVEAYSEKTPWGVKCRRYLNINHHGVVHIFSIDDPLFAQRHKLEPWLIGEKQVRFSLDPTKTVIIASLTPPLNGYHYKIAATIFELE